MFTFLDFSIFAGFLCLSLFVGIYHAVMAKFGKQKLVHSESADFLIGERKLPLIPVCLSLLTTFISGVALIGVPSEIYLRGVVSAVAFLGLAISFAIVGIFFVPVFYKLQFISIYEYFEMRFDSKILRRIGSILFMFSTLFYMAVVLYAPSVALSNVTNVQIWPLILSIGLVSTIYTAIGGIKAVIWTDTLQAAFMYIGVGTLVIKGVLDSGGLMKVIEIAEEEGRLGHSVFKFNPTPFQYNSFWITTIGGIFHWCCFNGLNQMAIQRYCSMKSVKHARMVIGFTVPAFILLGGTSYLIGIVMLGYFYGCDPVTYGKVQTPDQISILMAVKVLSIIPGFPGVFLAAIYAATLSTISGGMNSMAAVLFEDFLKDKYKHWTEKEKTLCLKIVTTIFGISATGLSFACAYMGGIYLALMTVLTAATGPLVGLFFLGLFFPKANKNGAFAGVIVATILMTIFSTCNIIEKPYKNYILPYTQNTGNPNCVGIVTNSSFIPQTVSMQEFIGSEADQHYGDPEASLFSKVSPFSYALISLLIVMIVGHFVSIKFPVETDPEKENLMQACTYAGRNIILNLKPMEMTSSIQSEIKFQANLKNTTRFE